jgi:hypothetical protein
MIDEEPRGPAMNGKCPACGQTPRELHVRPIDTIDPQGRRSRVLQFVCPYPECDTILGVTMDPFEQLPDIADAVVKRLTGQNRRS